MPHRSRASTSAASWSVVARGSYWGEDSNSKHMSVRERNGLDTVVNCEMQYEQMAFLKNNHIYDRCKWENVRLCYTLFRIKLKFKSWFFWLGLDFWWLDVGFFLLLLMNSFPFRDLPLPTGYRDIEDGCETSSMGKRQGVRWMFRCVIEITSFKGIEPGFVSMWFWWCWYMGTWKWQTSHELW